MKVSRIEWDEYTPVQASGDDHNKMQVFVLADA